MTTRMTSQRLAGLIAAGEADPVREAVTVAPRLLTGPSNATGRAAGHHCTSPSWRATRTSSGCWWRPAPT